MKRQIILDTETTGLSPQEGHRIIEIGCVELVNRCLTGASLHCYINPEREIDREAEQVHGISQAFLQDKPKFADMVGEFISFVKGAELIIHNAPFDIGFIDHELQLLRPAWPTITQYCEVLDTLLLARKLHPGQRNSLDALCKRYSIDNTHRTLHGALLDAQILALVYLAMTGGQESLKLDMPHKTAAQQTAMCQDIVASASTLVVQQASEEENRAHQHYLEMLEKASGQTPLWKSLA